MSKAIDGNGYQETGGGLRSPSRPLKNSMSHELLLIRFAREMVKRNIEIGKELKAKYHWLDEIDHVFVQQGPHTSLIGKPLTQVTHLSWRKALKKAGLPAGIRFHDCRHRFATLHKRARTDDRLIMHLGGWESSKSMERYSHITTPDAERAAHNLSNIWKG
jgi:integrase